MRIDPDFITNNILTIRAHNDIIRTDKWIDDNAPIDYQEQPLGMLWGRVGKLGEEVGEAIQALIGVTGQNPRKGVQGTFIDVQNELADVVFTALCAMQHISKNTDNRSIDDILHDRLTHISHRISESASAIPDSKASPFASTRSSDGRYPI